MNLLILTVLIHLLQLVMRVSSMPLAGTKTKGEDESILMVFGKNRFNISRRVFLYARHTFKFVKITSKKINALTTKEDKHAELILTTRNLYGGVSIQGKHSKAFLCMSRAGRVILQKTFEETKCMFRMRIRGNGFITFRLASNETWFLGFKKNGATRHGHETGIHHTAAWFMYESE